MKRIVFTIIATIILASCASQSSNRSPEDTQAQIERLKQSPRTWNPAPNEMFSSFNRFEFNEPQLSEELQADEKKVASVIETNQVVTDRLDPVFENWQQQNTGSRTLIIESTYSQYKIVSGGARFWGGALAGDSSVKLNMEIKDKSSGSIIASPFFFQRANSIGGAWTLGAHDQSIPDRLSSLIEKYIRDNYSSLEGGPTGHDE